MQRSDFFLAHHQMERTHEILAHHGVHHPPPTDHLIDVDAKRPLAHTLHLLFHLFIRYILVDQRVDGDDRPEELQADLDLPVFHVGQDEMDALLAQSVETLMAGEGLFAFLEHFAPHVY